MAVPTRQEPPIVTIRYCTGCRWLLRAQWYQGELLQTFADDLGGVTLIPSHGGMFRVAVFIVVGLVLLAMGTGYARLLARQDQPNP